MVPDRIPAISTSNLRYLQWKERFRGGFLGAVAYLIAGQVLETKWVLWLIFASFLAGVAVSGMSLSLSYWVGRRLRIKSVYLSVSIGLTGYVLIVAVAIAMAIWPKPN